MCRGNDVVTVWQMSDEDVTSKPAVANLALNRKKNSLSYTQPTVTDLCKE